MRTKTATAALVLCPECSYHRTRNDRCARCQTRHDAREKMREALAATPGTIQHLGAGRFLTRVAELMEAEGFVVGTAPHNPPPFNPNADRYLKARIAEECTCHWPAGHDRRCPATGDYLRLLANEAGAAARFEMTIANHARHVAFDLRVDDREVEWYGVSGTTSFNANADGSGHVLTFDRTGVEDSFSCPVTATPEAVVATLLTHLPRIDAARERRARSVSVPGLPGGWLVSPERRIEIAALLRTGKGTSFTPSGFGTGYRVYPNRPASRYSVRLPAETSTFFGVAGPLFYDTLDCD